ncbi:hypothetical protein LCGC14_0648710 [marine sediment metagenome]|uniref:Guanylate cyclase domain-containing protein n=1 Tax=marine sediment metagenome TaxID=412755 RepID=A0A0F9TIR9_9ZZZZ
MMARFIGMLDILGFTRLVEERGIMEIHKVISELFKSIQRGTSIDFSAIIDGKYYRHPAVRLDYFIFSDTILIWKDYQEISEDIREVNGDCDLFREFNMGIEAIVRNALRKNIPLRGGLAFGESIINIDKSDKNNNEIIGQSIVDAYLVGEAQNWIGVAFHSSCLDFIQHKCDPRVFKHVELPFHEKRRSSIRKGYVTNYTLEWGEKIEIETLQGLKQQLIDKEENPKIIQKYDNAIAFLKTRRSD